MDFESLLEGTRELSWTHEDWQDCLCQEVWNHHRTRGWFQTQLDDKIRLNKSTLLRYFPSLSPSLFLHDSVSFSVFIHCVIILSLLSVCLTFCLHLCWYTILLFSLLAFTAPPPLLSLSLSLFIHSVTVHSLGSFKSLSLLDAALNGKSIHAACLWRPKNSVQQLSIYNGLFMFQRAFHSNPLSCVEPGLSRRQQ